MIDDDPDFVEGIRPILLDAGYDVDVRYTSHEGWETLQQGGYDLLLLDIMMGRGAEGVMLAERLRKDETLSKLPRLFVTALRQQTSFLRRKKGISKEFAPEDELVEKPVDPDLLLEKIAGLLGGAG
jgi:CheY-like chemotaxis protein